MRMFCLCCIHATFALFYCLLFNLNLNSYEFEFKLNVFESFQKWKNLPFPLSFSAQPDHLFFFFSPFSSFPRPRKPSRRPVPFPSPFCSLRPKTTPRRPISFPRPAPPPLSHHHCHAGPARQAFLLRPPVCATDSAESGRRPSSALRLGAHAKGLGPGLYKAPTPPWNPIEPKSPQPPPSRANPSRRHQYSELGAADTAPSFRRSFDVLNLL